MNNIDKEKIIFILGNLKQSRKNFNINAKNSRYE